MQSHSAPERIHVAIIMDGNGRWATRRGLPRIAGHRAGAKAVRRIIEAAPNLGIGTLTLFAFSSDNWQRPSHEVNTLMRLFREYLASETEQLRGNGIRLNVIGRRDRLSAPLCAAIESSERATAAGQAMLLRVAVDYSSRDSILLTARQLRDQPEITREQFASALGEINHGIAPAPDVDLLIRTSGEQRLSDFLLWECAYAELCFVSQFWPDFEVGDLHRAVTDFQSRDRRFGRVAQAAVG